MTDPKIVTDADTVARLAKAAKAIGRILGADNIVMIETVGQPRIAAVGERSSFNGSWIGVAIETGDVWIGPGPDTVPAPKAADDTVPAHPGGDRCNDPWDGPHLTENGHCICIGRDCCSDEEGECVCRWGCTSEDHGH